MRFKIFWASLIVGRKFPVFASFYFVDEGNFQVQAPGGGTYIWRSLFSEFYGTPIIQFVRMNWSFPLKKTKYPSECRYCSDEIHSCLRTFISNTARTATILNRDNTRRQCSKQYSRQCVETDQFWSLLRVNAQAANTR